MLPRSSSNIVRYVIPRSFTCFRQQHLRFLSKVKKNNLGKVTRYRDNNWIGSSNNGSKSARYNDNAAYQHDLKIEGSVASKDQEFKQLLQEVFNHLKQSISMNRFLYESYESVSISQTAEEALDTFRVKLEVSLKRFGGTGKNAITLDQLISPNVEMTPSLIYHTLKSHPTAQRYFEKQGISDPVEKAYQIIEKSYHELLFTFLSANLPARKLGVDISNPAEWFPEARKLRRKLILHVGPTNSGKTYHALKRLKEANDGYYAGPLRLLAREIYERFQSEGVRCNLITGEEVINDLDEYGMAAPLSSGTVEMVSTTKKFEVVVLDEIQMMGDLDRGWAWTNALLGVQAKEVHLCGEESVIPLIKKIASITGDEVYINKYTRLGKLELEEDIVKDGLFGLKKGDCIVAFSKKRIWAYKEEIQSKTDLKCGVIYGALPAEVRSTEANKFNSGEYDVLVASDAIGMGLNLSINRVIFDSHTKFNGTSMEELESPIVKQIGGRAGRFKVAPASGSVKAVSPKDAVDPQEAKKSSIGYVGAFSPKTLEFVSENIGKPTIFLEKAFIWPSDEIWTRYTSEFPSNTPFTKVIEAFEQEVKSAPLYDISSTRDRVNMGKVFIKINNLLIDDQLRIGTAPLGTYLPLFAEVIHAYSETIARGLTKSVLDFDILPFKILNDKGQDKLQGLEELHKYVLLFLWMNNRYPTFFVNRESAVDIKTLLESKIEKILRTVKTVGIGGGKKNARYRKRRRYGKVEKPVY